MFFKITWKTHIICLLMALLLTQAMSNILDIIINNFFIKNFIYYPTNNLIINFYIDIAILMIPITIVHELVHGLTYRIFGGKVKYGFKIIYAYTREVSGLPIERTKFLVILLSPVVGISLLSLVLPVWIKGMIYLLNLLGSIGDIYMAFILCRHGYNSKIIDKEYGFDVVN